MTIRTRRSPGGDPLIVVDGEIDLANAAELDDAIAAARAGAPGSPVRVDLSGAAYLDSAGVRVLFAHAGAGALVVYAPHNPTVAALLTLTGFDAVAEVVSDGAPRADGRFPPLENG
jgi:anti-anti-sigma factor